MASKERELEVDLENGGTTSEEDGNNDLVLSDRQSKKSLKRLASGFFIYSESVKDEYSINSCNNFAKFGKVAAENIELLTDNSSGGEECREHVAVFDKKHARDKPQKTNSKRPPKPPRPPKGLTLDAGEQKLVKELTELAMKKRARTERIKALKKTRAAKPSSSNGNLSAMVITVIFFLVIIFQGIFSRSNSSMISQDSPARVTKEALISVQYYKKPSAKEGNEPISKSLNLVKQISGWGFKKRSQ